MKTAISIPNEIFEQAERQAAELGISRSEFFSRAAKRYLAELDAESLTDRINAALDATSGGDADLTHDVTDHSRRVVTAESDEW